LQQTGFIKEVESARSSSLGKHLVELVANALAAYLANLGCHFPDRRKGVFLKRAAKPGGKAYRAHHAQLVFAESGSRIADGANHPCLEICTTTNKVEDFFLFRIVEQPVDSEVAPRHVFFWRLGISHRIGMPAVGVRNVRAVRRHFNLYRRVAASDL